MKERNKHILLLILHIVLLVVAVGLAVFYVIHDQPVFIVAQLVVILLCLPTAIRLFKKLR